MFINPTRFNSQVSDDEPTKQNLLASALLCKQGQHCSRFLVNLVNLQIEQATILQLGFTHTVLHICFCPTL